MNNIVLKTAFILQCFILAFSVSNCRRVVSNHSDNDMKDNDIQHISLNAIKDREDLLVDFYDHICSDTVLIEKDMALMYKNVGAFVRIGEYDSVPSSVLTFVLEGEKMSIDSVLGFGKPYLSKSAMKILIPIVNYQYDDLEFGGPLLSLDFNNHHVATITDLINSTAMTVVDDICYYISDEKLYKYNISTGETSILSTLSDETRGVVMAFFSLNKSSSGYFTVTYYSDFTNDILNGVEGKEARFKLFDN